MSLYGQLSTLRDKIYSFGYKDSVFSSKRPKTPVRTYLVIAVLNLIGLSCLLIWYKKTMQPESSVPTISVAVEPTMRIEPVHAATDSKIAQDETIPAEGTAKITPLTAQSVLIKEDTLPEEHQETRLEEPIIESTQFHNHPFEKEGHEEKPRNTIELVSHGDKTLDTLYRKGISLLKQKKLSEASAIFQRDDIIVHSHGKSLTLLLRLLLNERSYTTMDALMKKHGALYAGERNNTLMIYGYSLFARKLYTQLIQEFSKVTPPVQTHAAYYSLLAQAYIKGKNYAKGKAVYELLLANHSHDRKWLIGLLITQVGLKDLENARITLEKLHTFDLADKELALLTKVAKVLEV